VGNSRPLDDRLRLSHSALVSTLAWLSKSRSRVVAASLEYKACYKSKWLASE
jgi:hypothetical protein